jgi:hypothetical protein
MLVTADGPTRAVPARSAGPANEATCRGARSEVYRGGLQQQQSSRTRGMAPTSAPSRGQCSRSCQPWKGRRYCQAVARCPRWCRSVVSSRSLETPPLNRTARRVPSGCPMQTRSLRHALILLGFGALACQDAPHRSPHVDVLPAGFDSAYALRLDLLDNALATLAALPPRPDPAAVQRAFRRTRGLQTHRVPARVRGPDSRGEPERRTPPYRR